MDKEKLTMDIAEKLMKLASDLNDLAGSLQAMRMDEAEDQKADKATATEAESAPASEAEPASVPEPVPEISLEKVRGILADKSRAGFTAQVREIIKKYGATRLSEVKSKDYAAVIAEAEALV